jgi:hypothetical protein
LERTYEIKDEFFDRGSFTVGDREITRFWKDMWLGDNSLANQYPYLHNIVQRKQVLVANFMDNVPLNVGFTHTLAGGTTDRWTHLVWRLMSIQLTTQPDTFSWKLTPSDSFTVKSLYLDFFMNDHTTFLRKCLRKMKVPLKVSIFMWFIQRHVLLTKDNFVKIS